MKCEKDIDKTQSAAETEQALEQSSQDCRNEQTLEAVQEANYMLTHPEKSKPLPVDVALKMLGI